MKQTFTKKKNAIELHMRGWTNKSIALAFEVTEKTVCDWLKEIKHINYTTELIKLYKRFDTLISNENADIKDIHNLNNVISSIEKKLSKSVKT